MKGRRRVIVGGMGIISPVGNCVEEFKTGIKMGRSGIEAIKAFVPKELKHRSGGEIKNFDPRSYFSRRDLRRMSRASQIVLAAAREAVKMSGINFSSELAEMSGVCLGSTLGGMISAGRYYRLLKTMKKPTSSLLLDYPLYSAGSRLCVEYGLFGRNISISTACSSSNIALGHAFDLIRGGEQEVMLAGGYDTMAEITWAGFGVLRNVSPDICRPFDKNRQGLVLGEGAAILVLEELERCRQRGGTILGEILGYGMSSDAYHMTAPDVTGKGPAIAMGKAIEDAGLLPRDINYICAHGTGTLYNDSIETRAIKKVFGEYARSIPVSSNKSMLGHTLGASGAISMIASLIAMNNGFIPPTINYETPDPNCDLDYVPNTARETEVEHILFNNFGFGGNNCSIVIGKYQEGNDYAQES